MGGKEGWVEEHTTGYEKEGRKEGKEEGHAAGHTGSLLLLGFPCGRSDDLSSLHCGSAFTIHTTFDDKTAKGMFSYRPSEVPVRWTAQNT